jgi:hypothetical protein
LLTSQSPFNLAARRARRLLDRIERKIQRGELPTQAQFLAELLSGIQQFAASLHEPSMEVRRMGRDELLIREHLTDPLDEAQEDLELSFEQISLLRDLTRQTFNVCLAEQAGLKDALAEDTALVDAYRLWVSDSDPGFLWFGDTFNDVSKTDPGSTAFVDTLAGVVSLPPTDKKPLSDRVQSITIDRSLSAGGLPGNNLEIRQPGREAGTGDRKEPRPVLFSDSQPRKDWLPAVLDGDPDTWFEWERVYLPIPQPVVPVGRAFVADPGGKPKRDIAKLANWNCYVRFPGDFQTDTGLKRGGFPLAYFKTTDRQDLRLALQIVLDQPRRVSWLQLTPFLRGQAYPEVEQLLISADGQTWRSLIDVPTTLHPRINRGVDFSSLGAAASNFEGVGVWAFPATPIQYVKIVLKQSQSYQTSLGIGHRFYLDRKGKKRVKGPITVVGSFESKLGSGPAVDFTASEVGTDLQLQEVFDIFSAERQAIGIRDLLLEERLYAVSAQWTSKPFLLPEGRPAKVVALLATEQIPEEWGAADENGQPWIRYEISPDGQIWTPIIPQRAQLEDSTVRFEEPAASLYLRATFSRPADAEGQTPLIQAYAMKVLPGS